MTSAVSGRLAALRAAAARAGHRQADHAGRVVRALRAGGPGRLPGQVLHVAAGPDHLLVEGWAALPRRGPTAVLVTVDGAVVASAALGLPTPVGPDEQPMTRWSGAAGWRAVVPHGFGSSRRLVVGALAVLDSGLTEALIGTTTVSVPELPVGFIDQPAAGQEIEGAVAWVQGWLRPDLDVSRLEVVLGDQPPTRARPYAVPRPDIATLSPDPAAPMCGWHALVDLPPALERSEVDLVLVAHGSDAAFEVARHRVRIGSCRPTPVADDGRVAALQARTAIALRDDRRHLAEAGPAIHLLVVTHHLGLGGGQLYLQGLLTTLLRREDLRCTVLSSADGVLRDELEALGAVVHVVGQTPPEGLGYEAWVGGVGAYVLAAGVPDVVLANTAGSFWGVDLASRLDRPAVWAIHESFTPEQFAAAGFPRALDGHVASCFRQALSYASAVVFEADATAAMYAAAVDDARRQRIDYGIDLERIESCRAADRAALRARLGFAATDTILLGMGTFEPRKGQAPMALAFARLAADHPDAKLVLVGDTGGPYSDALRAVVDRLALGDRVRLEPVTPDIDGWYHAADALVIGADIESLPMSMLEAMAFGRPVIAASVFGIPEVIHDGVEGILFEPLDLPALERALRRFLLLPSGEREAMSQKAREVADGRPLDSHGDAVGALIDELLDRG